MRVVAQAHGAEGALKIVHLYTAENSEQRPADEGEAGLTQEKARALGKNLGSAIAVMMQAADLAAQAHRPAVGCELEELLRELGVERHADTLAREHVESVSDLRLLSKQPGQKHSLRTANPHVIPAPY